MTDYRQDVERNRSWNFAVNVADLSFFNLAMALLFPSTILPLFASHLTGSAVLILGVVDPRVAVARGRSGLRDAFGGRRR